MSCLNRTELKWDVWMFDMYLSFNLFCVSMEKTCLVSTSGSCLL